MGIRRVVIPHCGGEISLLHRRLVGACRGRLVGACRAPCSKRGESAGARPSGFISRALDTPTGTNVGEGRLGDMRAAERAGNVHGATTAPKRAFFEAQGSILAVCEQRIPPWSTIKKIVADTHHHRRHTVPQTPRGLAWDTVAPRCNHEPR